MVVSVEEGNPYAKVIRELPGHGRYFSLRALQDPRVARLPYTIRVLLESALRFCDDFEVTRADVETILNWPSSSREQAEVPFKPARVLLQDFTGVPAAVDLAAMRDAMARLGGDPKLINPLVPVDLIIDHSVQVDVSRSPSALKINEAKEFERNKERFEFLKWAAGSFGNMLIVPPGSGICHQINLEYLARVVFSRDGFLFPDSLIGTDSHTTMIDGLGVVGWGVGGIEAEAVMLGQPISMVLPEVVGFELRGELPVSVTATDLVLTLTEMLRKRGVVGKFVEFFGEGCRSLTIADRATISNMSPEFGATMGFFPIDAQTLAYLKQSGRSKECVERVEQYLKAQGLFREYNEADDIIEYSGEVLRLDLATVSPCVAGPKRPHDRLMLNTLSCDFRRFLTAKQGFRGFGVQAHKADAEVSFMYKGNKYSLRHGSVVIAAITSCTNTSNPSVMLGAALLAENACEKGLVVPPYIKTSLSPGSRVVEKYLNASRLLPYLEKLGFFVTGFGCQTCIGNSGDLDSEVEAAIKQDDLVVCAVLSGNRNFEGRVHPLTRGNFLASPMLVVAFAIAGRMDIDLTSDPLASGADGSPVYLSDIWPTKESLLALEREFVSPAFFQESYAGIESGGSQSWKDLPSVGGVFYPWSEDSTYIHNPPFFRSMTLEVPPVRGIHQARCLLLLGDFITTDHISPAGAIASSSPAADYLASRGIERQGFNTYGSRRGNDIVMTRGTFANIRIINKLVPDVGPFTKHFPSGDTLPIYHAAMRYAQEDVPLIVLAGKEYGCGSSRDWAAKGPSLLGVRAIIAQSFERIHRSNLIGMGILPLQFLEGESVEQLKLSGSEILTIEMTAASLMVGAKLKVTAVREDGHSTSFGVLSRIDTEVEIAYYKHGGILNFVIRKLMAKR